MKNLKNLLIFFGLAATVMSCSDKDDDPTPLKDVEFGLFADNNTMEVAQTMMTSDNTYANEAGSLINSINPATHSAFFTVPQGATKIDGPVVAANARTNGSVVTYKWTSPEAQGAVVYQVTEQSDSYYYEIFLQYEEGGNYVKFIEGQQTKDRKSGYLVVLTPDETERIEWIRYEFEIRSDRSIFIKYTSDFYNLDALFNANKSGYIKLYDADRTSVTEEYNWDGAGNGSWVRFDETGAEAESVEWTS